MAVLLIVPANAAAQVQAYRNQPGTKMDVQSIDVLPLEVPGNPYAGQYELWDHWIAEHAGQFDPRSTIFREDVERMGAEWRARQAESGEPDQEHGFDPYSWRTYVPSANDPWISASAWVDDDGFQIPLALRWPEERAKELARDPRTFERHFPWVPPYYVVNAWGLMDDDVRRAMLQAKWDVFGPDYPSVPDWLHAQPVVGVVFAPNGELATLGPLGSRPESGAPRWAFGMPELWQTVEPAWCRYSANGELLGKSPFDAPSARPFWAPHQVVWFSGFRELAQEWLAERGNWQDFAGYMLFYESWEQGTPLHAAYDFDGTLLALEDPLPQRSIRFSQRLDWQEVSELYHWQRGMPMPVPATPQT